MRPSPSLVKRARLPLVLFLAIVATSGNAAIDNGGVLNTVLSNYQAAASTWQSVITARATWLFWSLATISMVWTFGMMALRKADIGEFFAEFLRFTITTGFFWWLLTNGPNFSTSIMDGLRQVAASASGNPTALAPSGIVDIGFNIFFSVIQQSSVWTPVDTACGILISAIVLVVLALVSVNMLILLISGWILAYAGIFVLGFGGSKWTSDLAIGYFKSVLGVALQLMTMVLLVGIGKSFVDQYYNAMSAGINMNELGVMLVVSVVLLALVNKVPPLIGALAGGHIHALGQGFGAGEAVGAAAIAGAAVATAGAAMAGAASSMGGGAQAVMAAFSKANASANGGGGSSGMGDMLAAANESSSDDSGGGSTLAAAMGDVGGTSSMASSSFGGSLASQTNGCSSSPGLGSGGSEGGAPGEVQSGSSKATAAASAASSLAGKAGRVAAGTVGNLAKGTWDVAQTKASSIKEAAMEAMSQSTGGKIAAAINARAQNEATAMAADAAFDNNSLSAGNQTSADAESEVAAFRDGPAKT